MSAAVLLWIAADIFLPESQKIGGEISFEQ